MVIIYDGNNTAYRNNCVTELYTKQGERVSAIFGTLNSIKKDLPEITSLSKKSVNEVIFVWDFGKSERRMALYPEYKGNRRKDQTADEKEWFKEFLHQANYLHENLRHFGIKSFKVKGWEADDIAYALTEEIEDDIVLVSTDEDWLQMIRSNVSVYSPTKKSYICKENFEEKIGVPIRGFVSYKALRGDSSDNIPGIDGIGEVIGKKLINDYGSIDGLLKGKEVLEKSKRTAKIFTPEGEEILKRNMELMDLSFVDYDSIMDEIDELMDDEVYIDTHKIMSILKEKQFVSILTEFNKWIKVFQSIHK